MRSVASWYLVGLAVLVLFVLLVILTRPLADSLLIAALVAYLLNPLVCWLQRRWRWPRSVAVSAIYVATFLVLAGLVAAFGAVAWAQLPRLTQELTEALTEMQTLLTRPMRVLSVELNPTYVVDSLGRSAGNALAALPVSPVGMLGAITDNLLWSSVALVSLFYFLKDGPRLKPWLVAWLPPAAQEDGHRLLEEIDLLWSVFLRMQLLIFLILALMFGISTLLIIWLYRSGWLPLSWLGLAIVFVLVYTVIQQVDNFWLRPQLLGHSLQLHPGIVFVALIAALALSGVLGAIIIVPVLATLKLLSRYIHARLLGMPAWPEAVPPPSDL
ncbi:MAG: hypothetical protein FOGNACKC_03828 [Anaerolineae bacterium]|nr:hypothetical protein [Anaerolineae bacterium]